MSRIRSLLSIDCWDTLLSRSDELDLQISRALVEELARYFRHLTAAEIAGAISSEAREFSTLIRAADRAVNPYQRVTSLLRSLGRLPTDGQPSAKDRAFIDRTLRHVDGATSIVLPELMDGAEEFLRSAARSEYIVCMISNTGWLSSSAVQYAFEAYGLTSAISNWYFSGDGYRPKPNPEMFHAALDEHGCTSDSSVHIGDQYRTDMRGACAAGMRPIVLSRCSNKAVRTVKVGSATIVLASNLEVARSRVLLLE